VITSYAHIAFSKNDKKEEVTKDIHSVKWDRIVFDEAHHLRNKNTCIYKGALGLQGRIKWLVSGTPIQNKKADFYNLCKIIGISEHLYKNDENYPVIRRDYILKRTKKEVGISIPDLNVNLEAVCWKNSNEMNMSCDIHSFLNFSKGSSSNNSNSNSMKVSCWLSCQFDNGVLPLYLRARQMCIYPKLVRKFVRDMVIDGIITESEYADVIKYSSKLDAVIMSILRNKDNGNGKIIFCSFREEIDDIALRLKEKGFNSVATFDGRNNGASRKTILVEKNDVLILQIQTGCEGLNLQEHYSEVYFVSPNWNPAIEEQAVARCHRIGQKKNVNVYRFEMIPFVIEDEEGLLEEKEFVLSMSIDNYMNIVQENKLIIAREILEV
jgi:SNF2 family DNA or RNA helicase